MSARTVSRILLALAAAMVVPAIASADRQAYRFEYPGPCLACALGPGAARGLQITINGGLFAVRGSAETEGVTTLVSATFLGQSAPACKEPTVDEPVDDTVDCNWENDCVFPLDWVELCLEANGPIESVVGIFTDQFGEPLAMANVTPVSGCDELDCSGAFALVPYVWPPNHKLTPVSIEGVTGGQGDVDIVVTGITQDEPLNANGNGDGDTCPDGAIVDDAAWVRMERAGNGDGRVYVVSFTATDESGTSCNGTVEVCVKHDPDHSCVDSGQDYVSTDSCDPEAATAPALDLAGTASLTVATSGDRAELAFALETASRVDIGVFDVAGRRVATVEQGVRQAGLQQVSWSVSNLSRGMYFVRVHAGETVMSKALLVR